MKIVKEPRREKKKEEERKISEGQPTPQLEFSSFHLLRTLPTPKQSSGKIIV